MSPAIHKVMGALQRWNVRWFHFTRYGRNRRNAPNCFDRLPIELMQEILGWIGVCTVDDSRLRRLARVCLAFRNAINYTPSFWNDIHVDLKPSRGSQRWIMLKIRRSQEVPLHVSIHNSQPQQRLIPTFEAVLAHSERWESLTLDIHLETLLDLFPQINVRFSSLRRLTISVTPGVPTPQEQPFPPIFDNAPLLDTIIFSPMSYLDISSLPFHQVSHVHINEGEILVRPPILRTIFREESRLQELRVSLSAAAPGDWIFGRMVAPQLTTLFLQETGVMLYRSPVGRTLEYLLECLTAPSLRNFGVSCRMVESSALLRFVTKSSCALKRLELPSTLVDSTIIQLLNFVSPTLTHLKLFFYTSDPKDVGAFPQFSSPSFLPHLISLVFFIEDAGFGRSDPDMGLWFDPAGFAGDSEAVDLIGLSRCELHSLGKRLEHFELEWREGNYAQGMQQVFARQSISDCGLDVEFRYDLRERTSDSTRLGTRETSQLPLLLEWEELIFQKLDHVQYLYVSCY